MNYEILKEFHEKIKGFSRDYLSMVAVGSIITGDPYIKGRSDKDIVLVFSKISQNDLSNLENLIQSSNFDEDYVFTLIPKNVFGISNSKYSFSNKFRSKTLFGEDFVKTSKLPEKEKIKEIYSKGLEDVSHQLYNQIINSSLWSVEKARDKFWKQFKHAFMNLAIREYYFSEDYPKTRKEIAKRLNSNEINKTLETLHSIDCKSKEEIVECAKGLVNYLNSLDDGGG